MEVIADNQYFKCILIKKTIEYMHKNKMFVNVKNQIEIIEQAVLKCEYCVKNNLLGDIKYRDGRNISISNIYFYKDYFKDMRNDI